MPAHASGYFGYERPREGHWGYGIEIEAYGSGLSGNHRLGYGIIAEPRYFISDAFQLHAGAQLYRVPDWLLWQRDNLVGSFDGREIDFSAGLTWLAGRRHELRVKLQTIGLDAQLRQAYRVAPDGKAIPTDDPVDDFSLRSLGFQVRYRFELAPLSYLYVVYGRGGYEEESMSTGASRQLRDSFSLRDDEQLMVKVSYRFER